MIPGDTFIGVLVAITFGAWLAADRISVALAWIRHHKAAALDTEAGDYGPRLVYGDLPLTDDIWWPFYAPEFTDPDQEAAQLRAELNSEAAVVLWLSRPGGAA